MDCIEPLIVKAMLKSKLVMNVDIPEVYPQLEVVQKSLIVDSSPKLTNNDWIREQSEDPNISLIIQLLKSDKLKKYVAREMDSSEICVLLKCCKDYLLKNGLLYQKVLLKNHSQPISQFVLPKSFVCKVIFGCHDDNRHLGMERTLGVMHERFFWPKMADDMHIHICTCDWCTRFKQPQEKTQVMQPVVVSYPLELIHLGFLTVGGKADGSGSVNILVVMDHFTKYAQAYVIPKQTALVVVQTLWENFLVHYGWSEKILSDKENPLKIVSLENSAN